MGSVKAYLHQQQVAEPMRNGNASGELVLTEPQHLPSSTPVIRTIAMPADTNPAGDIFGGWLMAQMDLAAGSLATRRARGRCATVAVQSMTFYSPVFVGDEVSMFATITGTGRSSIQILVEAWRRDRTGEDVSKVTQAAFTFVAIDDMRRSRTLPPLGGNG